MDTVDSDTLMSPLPTASVQTNVDPAILSSRNTHSENLRREAWQQLINQQLIEWGRDAGQFEDEGVEPPTRATVQRAIDVARKLSDAGLPAPNSVVPDANGGIVFERREKDCVAVIHVWDDGMVEYQRFHGTRLIERRPL